MSEVEQLDKLLNLLTELKLLEEGTNTRLENTLLSPKKTAIAFQFNNSSELSKKESSLESDSLLSQLQNLTELPAEAIEVIESISYPREVVDYPTANEVEGELPINQVLELIQSLSSPQKELNPSLWDFEEARELPVDEKSELIQSLNYSNKKLVAPTLNEFEETKELPIDDELEPTLSLDNLQEDSDNLTANNFKEAILDNLNKTIETIESEENNSFDETNQPEELDDPLQGLKRLLIAHEMIEVRDEIEIVEQKLGNLERRIYDPKELSELLLPLIAQVLSLKITQSKQEVVEAIVPIIAEVIENKIGKDKEAMAQALSTVIPDAISQQIKNSPQDISQAIAPMMGEAIKQQIILERDSMVDALYPIIGSTVSKYMVDVVNSINEKIETTLSTEGLSRKIRAKIQGVSEAELILKESVPFRVRAIFLIHKTSGLLISEMQQVGAENLESDLMAGMLTAIRSFANDCMVEPGKYSELNEIEYDNFKIMMEVAGYCYLVVVSSGAPPQPFIQRMQKTLSTIIQKHGKEVEEFDGDSETIPEEIHHYLERLINSVEEPKLETKKQKIPPLLILSLGLVGAIAFWGWSQWRDRTLETTALNALESTPELAVYRLETTVRGNSLKLKGKLPNRYLREKAALIAIAAVPDLAVDNQILAVEVPPDPVQIEAEVKRTLALFNQTTGTSLSASSTDLDVTLQGKVSDPADLRRITEALKRIPGLKSTVGVVQLQPQAIATRLYFEANSSLLTGIQRDRLNEVRQLLRSPNLRLKIIGHTDGTGSVVINEQLAQQRAMTVKNALIALGIAPQRLQIAWSSQPPPDAPNKNRQSLSRCVRFEPVLEISN